MTTVARVRASRAPLDVDTPQGRAVVQLEVPRDRDQPAGLVVLGHGAGGGVGAPDLVAASDAAVALGWAVALVEQPYRVAGRRVAPRPTALDEAWTAVVERLRDDGLGTVPLITGGRSAGARVACRTATATASDGVLCLAFPTRPPGRGDRPSRLPELEAPRVPVLVVQGATDPYGVPPTADGRDVVVVPGDHGLKKDRAAVAAAVAAWLPRLQY